MGSTCAGKLRAACEEMHRWLVASDPVGGVWFPGEGVQTGSLWCDASDMAYGTVLEINNQIIDDAAWLRPQDNKRHINVAELYAVMKGLALASNWNVHHWKVCTDARMHCLWLAASSHRQHPSD